MFSICRIHRPITPASRSAADRSQGKHAAGCPRFLHEASTLAYFFILRFGGPALIFASVICYLGQPAGIWIDAIASLICGAILLLIGGYWIIVDHDLNDFLITIFALMLLGSGRRQLPMLLQSRNQAVPDEPPPPEPRRPVEPPPPPPTRATSVRTRTPTISIR